MKASGENNFPSKKPAQEATVHTISDWTEVRVRDPQQLQALENALALGALYDGGSTTNFGARQINDLKREVEGRVGDREFLVKFGTAAVCRVVHENGRDIKEFSFSAIDPETNEELPLRMRLPDIQQKRAKSDIIAFGTFATPPEETLAAGAHSEEELAKHGNPTLAKRHLRLVKGNGPAPSPVDAS